MPFPEQEQPTPPQEGQESRETEPAYRFESLEEAREYKQWREGVPQELRRVVEGVMQGRSPELDRGFPLSDSYLNALRDSLNAGASSVPDDADRRVSNLLQPLSEVRTQAGTLNVFDQLKSPDSSWSLKRELYERQIKPALEWLTQKDIEMLARQALERDEMPTPPEQSGKEGDGDEREESEESGEDTGGEEAQESEGESGGQSESGESGESGPDDTPPEDDKTSSSMEHGVEGREGPPGAHFSVTPYRGGYVRRRVYYGISEDTGRWLAAEGEEAPVRAEPMETERARVLYGVLPAGKRISVPLYYGWTLDPDSLQLEGGENVTLSRDTEGQWFLHNTGEESVRYAVTIGPRRAESRESAPETGAELGGTLPDELTQKITEIQNAHQAPIRRARELARFLHNSLTYSNEPEAWQYYRAEPERFFERVWERKETDCFVANTLLTRLLTEAGLTARMAGGYYIQEQGEQGEAVMHNGNGHGWCEVYDRESRRWVRLDATPGGDPTMDQEKQEQELGEESESGDSADESGDDAGEGDSDELLSGEELEDQLKELERQQEGKDTGERREREPRHSREVERFASEAEVDPERAKAFLEALERVRAITDSEGVSISERMIEQWKRIVEERRVEASEYRGPVRMDEGERLEDPVSAALDLRSGEPNPTGFERDESVEKKESDFGGLDIYFSFDLSASMNEPDPISGRRKADVQRDAALLFADSLMQCAAVSRKTGGSEKLPVKLMATLASKSGEVSLPLTAEWEPKQQVQFYESLNRVAGGSTPTHETLEQINTALEEEKQELDRRNVQEHKRPLHYVVELTDGMPNNPDATRSLHETLRESGAVVRSYLVGAEATAADAESVDSFERIPEILAKDIVEQFKKLQPRRVQ